MTREQIIKKLHEVFDAQAKKHRAWFSEHGYPHWDLQEELDDQDVWSYDGEFEPGAIANAILAIDEEEVPADG